MVDSQPFNDTTEKHPEVAGDSSSWIRGISPRGGRGRGRGRGRGAGRSVSAADTAETREADIKTTAPDAVTTTATENTNTLGTDA